MYSVNDTLAGKFPHSDISGSKLAMLTARVSLLNDYMSDIKGIKPPKPDTGEIQVGSLKGDGKTATPSKYS